MWMKIPTENLGNEGTSRVCGGKLQKWVMSMAICPSFFVGAVTKIASGVCSPFGRFQCRDHEYYKVYETKIWQTVLE